MCGICGIALPRTSRREIDEAALISMRDSLVHRGPDDRGSYFDSAVALGHRRLSIVDVGGGHQPMTNEDGTIWISFNGEIYNHRELRPALESAGHHYRSNSDTETIIHLYEEQGERAVELLRGMFAFALWDEKRGVLLLARDRLGIKPLYYSVSDDGTLWFASEIKALVEAGAVKPEVNYESLADYTANRGTSDEQTLFRGVRRVPPGHVLKWKDGHVELRSYWSLSYEPDDDPLNEAQYVSRFRELFYESVRLRLMADVPLGVFLSGGIDSSAIVAAMSEMVDGPIKTFSVAFAEREANELEYARMVAQEFGTDHHEVLVSPRQFFEALPSLVFQEDEPIAHASSVPLHFVSRLAAEHVKVVLTGEGSDELLAGYGKYGKTLYNRALGRIYQGAIPATLRRLLRRIIDDRRLASTVARKLSRTFLYLKPEINEIYFDNFSVFSREMQSRLFTAETLERMGARGPYAGLREAISRSDAKSLLNQLLAADMKSYLQELLMKQDQMSMSASIESRVPFLDHKLAEFAARLPERMKLRGLTTKYILRRAMRDRLPKPILSRRKMGFPVPLASWLRGRFSGVIDEYVLDERASARGIFNKDFVANLVARHQAGEDHSERLWSLINFEIWQRQFFDREGAANSKMRALAVEQAL